MALHTQDFEYVKTNHELKNNENSSQLGSVSSPINDGNNQHPTYQHYRSSGSLYRNKEFHMKYDDPKLENERYMAYPNNSYSSTNGANFNLQKEYNSRNGLDDNNLEDENEYNLNGMNYDYNNDHPLPSNELIVSNQPTQKSTLSVGVSTASFSSKSNGAPYYTGNRSGSTRRLKYLSGVNNQDSLTRKQKREMLNGYSRSVPNVNEDEDEYGSVANPGSSTLPKRTSSDRSKLPTYKQALIASRFNYPRSRRSSYSFSEDSVSNTTKNDTTTVFLKRHLSQSSDTLDIEKVRSTDRMPAASNSSPSYAKSSSVETNYKENSLNGSEKSSPVQSKDSNMQPNLSTSAYSSRKSSERNNSAREPLMSIVPEEGSIISNGTNVNNEINGKLEESSSPTDIEPDYEGHISPNSKLRTRIHQTLSNIQEFGTITNTKNSEKINESVDEDTFIRTSKYSQNTTPTNLEVTSATSKQSLVTSNQIYSSSNVNYSVQSANVGDNNSKMLHSKEQGLDVYDDIYQKKYIGNRNNSIDRSRYHSKFQNDITSSMRKKDRASDGALNVYNDLFHNYPPFTNRTASKVASYRALKGSDSPKNQFKVKLTRSSSYAGTMNNPYVPFSNNYFNRAKEPDDFRRSGSNFDTFGSRYQSNKLRSISKGINRQYSYGDVSDSPIKPRYQREGTNPPYASTGAMNYQVTSNKLITREDGDGESTLPVYNSLSGTHGTLGRGSKERRFLKNDQSGNSILQRKVLDGREKESNNIYEPNRKISPTTHIPSFRINRDTDTLTDEGYNTINTTIRRQSSIKIDLRRGNQINDPSDNDSDAEQENIENETEKDQRYLPLSIPTVYKIGSRAEFPVPGHASNNDNNFTTSLKNYNDPSGNDDPNFITDSTTILLSGVSNLALNGGQTKLPAPQTLAGGTKGRHPSDKGGVLFGRSESFKTNEHLEGVQMKHWINGLPHAKMDDKQSTLSRYWTMDRSLQRRLQKTNYQHIKRLCRDRGQLFEDVDFQPVARSLYKNKKPGFHPIVWLRPHEICQRPKFIAEGATRFDVEQGEVGDPWLLAAVSSLTLTPRFLDRVVPPDQNFEHGYCGVFRFRFWHFGDWVEVLIDDRLPTHKGRLVYLHSTDPSEFWAALLEKAYAKLYGNYEALHSGFTTKALQDLTGGIVQSFSLNSQDRLLTYQVLNSAVPRSTLLIASINIDGRHEKRTLRLRNGLITRHAYSVTGLARVRGQLGDRHLVRLRNPWGKGEWNGPWSERSWEWDSLSDRDKELLAIRVRNEGEFWMAFEDFASQFSHLDLVHIGPDDWMSEQALHSKRPWRAVLARRRWRSGYNAGGSPAYIETTAMNPQFHIQIPRSAGTGGGSQSGNQSNTTGGPSGSSKCHVVVSVTQQYETNVLETRKKKRKRNLHHIGFAVYEVPPHMTRLTPLYVAEHSPLDVTNHSVAREVVTFFTLPPGDYIIVPQTNIPNCDGKFLLRILTDEQSNIWEVNEDNVLFRNVLMEFEESFKYGYYEEGEQKTPSTKNRIRRLGSKSESRVLLSKLVQKYPPEIDASHLQKILRGHWKAYLLDKPSLELCKSLVMLRDYNISGRLNLMEIPVLLHMLHFWRNAFLKYVSGGSGSSTKTSSFNLRLILWEAGITVSNKVLECLVLRFAKNKVIFCEAYVTVMIRLHLAHERYHSIDTKMKGNPLSLEEMILMTIYS